VAEVTFSASDSAPVPKMFRIQVRIRKIFKFENPTPFQTLAAIDIVGNLPMFSLKKWPRRLLLLPKLKSGSGFQVRKKNAESCQSRLRCQAKFLTCKISDLRNFWLHATLHATLHAQSNILHIKYAEKTVDYGLGIVFM